MSTHGPPSPSPQPNVKRQRQSSFDETSTSRTGHAHTSPSKQCQAQTGHDPDDASAVASVKPAQSSNSSSSSSSSSNFRNVSACNRCRLRKNRCDQKLPSCASCAKVGVACVGYDPITKREIPRSYVFYLETRVEQLERLLASNDIPFPSAEDLELCSRPGIDSSTSAVGATLATPPENHRHHHPAPPPPHRTWEHRPQYENETKPDNQGEDGKERPAMVNGVSSSKLKSLAPASGVSFARVVFAAVQHSVSDSSSGSSLNDRSAHHHAATNTNSSNSNGNGNSGSTSMRDSFFGLHTKPSLQPATFPDKDVAAKLVTLYFEHANPQIPILHRGEFMRMFEQAYARGDRGVLGARELYMLNMVFAIGCGVIVGEPVKTETSASRGVQLVMDQSQSQSQSQSNKMNDPCRPEEYHASAIVHLEACLSTSGGGLEVLQAVLLLANFALLRPVPPGLWYIVGVAVRLAVDLGLHFEEGSDVEDTATKPPPSLEYGGNFNNGNPLRGNHPGNPHGNPHGNTGSRESTNGSDRGRRLWIRDLRRRLWWCTYSFDRLVSTCVGRPFGISDQVITTALPSVLDDDYITPNGFLMPPRGGGEDQPSYKYVAHHYFRLRKLQSEILQVLHYNQAEMVKAGSSGLKNYYPEMSKNVPCPYLVQFDSFRSWRIDIDRRLWHWKTSAPTRPETGVAFSTEFLELNYWQAIILLYRQSLSIPAVFEGEYNTSNEVTGPTAYVAELREDEDHIYVKIAEAGQKILRIYRQLHLSGLVSYTYLSTHHLFIAGLSYLYAIWHSPLVRSRLTLDEVDFTVLAAKSVFTDMIDKCPPAETCRDAFDRTVKATIKMASSCGGFGVSAQQQQQHHHHHQHQHQPQGQGQGRPTRQETAANWTHISESSSSLARCTSRHRGNRSEPGFPLDVSLHDNVSSPNSSIARDGDGGDILTTPPPPPPLGKPKPFQSQPRGRESLGPDGEAANAIDPPLMVSPSAPRRMNSHPPAGGNYNNSFMVRQQQQQQYGMHDDSVGYPDVQSMDFLQTLGSSTGGDLGGVDQGQMGLGFGLGWEGMHSDYGDGGQQQMNPFDTFFFGGQQGGNAHEGNHNHTSAQSDGVNEGGDAMAV